jgi:hypothetical protein
MEYQCNQRSREERRERIGASEAHNSAKNSAKFWNQITAKGNNVLANRFWKPGRGQNGQIIAMKSHEAALRIRLLM